MKGLKAFVAHSFNKDRDGSVVKTFLEYFDSLKDTSGFEWDHAEKAELKAISQKVIEKIEGKNLFVGIFTGKDYRIEQDKLKSLFRSFKFGKRESFKACSTAWESAGRGASGRVVEGMPAGIWMRGRGATSGASNSLVTLPLVGRLLGQLGERRLHQRVIRKISATPGGGVRNPGGASAKPPTRAACTSRVPARAIRLRGAGVRLAPIGENSYLGVGRRLCYGFHPASRVWETTRACSSILSRIASATPRV